MAPAAAPSTLPVVLMVAFLNPIGWLYLLGAFALGLVRARWWIALPYALLLPGLLWLLAENDDRAFALLAGLALAAALLPYAAGLALRFLAGLARRWTADEPPAHTSP